MRRSLPVVVLYSLSFGAACGGGGDGGPDGPPPVDARDVGPPAMADCTPKNGTTIGFEPVATGLDAPLLVTAAPGDARIFVVEQGGAIRVIKDGQLVETPFLDIGGSGGRVVQSGGESGLLGLAFHPDFRQNDRFYVHYSARDNGDHVISEFRAIYPTDTADPQSERVILRFSDPYTNHNAGSLEFGNDGMLYIAIGDGGAGSDPQERAQDLTSLFGKILRVDVDARTGSKEYGIPTDNPHASSADGAGDPRPEIWHYGLRNPFRFTFDPETGNIYIGDVGQSAWEEISAGPNTANINWGWDDREGQHCFEPANGCLTANRVDPVAEHAQTAWRSIMGGAVYRGPCFPDLQGTYFYGDHYFGRLWAFEYANGAAQNDRQVSDVNLGGLTSVHPDATGEMYVTTIDGNVRRIIVP